MNCARRLLARRRNLPFLLCSVIAASLVSLALQSAEVAPLKPTEESLAIRLAKQDVETNEKLFGPESKATADALHKLGMKYFDAAQFTNALPRLEQALKIHEEVSGPE